MDSKKQVSETLETVNAGAAAATSAAFNPRIQHT